MRKWRPSAEQKKLIREHLDKTKPTPCTACNGSGRYDTTGSPLCRACGGTGSMPQKREV